ncbi:hypothetical protein [Salisaeta longa]|uniref:hypothetical protein n=1 Tax=Salisaeta longa TaxID=503170 RepID=UPI0003B64166|nr:hypothetical protein [Salisaeta longa]
MRLRYRLRLLACLAGVLALLIAAVRLWPAMPRQASTADAYSTRAAEVITLQDIPPTQQPQQLRPPPPRPPRPVVVPNDVIIPARTDFDDTIPAELFGTDARAQRGDDGPTAARTRPDVGARLLRAVQPRVPNDVLKRLRARVTVAVHVDSLGRVERAAIIQRWRWSADARRAVPVQQLPPVIERAALAAARRAYFRPARAKGRPVPTETTLTFVLGDS